MTRPRVVVVGVGHMGALHASKLAVLPGAELAGVADTDRARVESIAERLGCAAFVDWREALRAADAAVIAVPTEQHVEVLRECVARGVHAMVEKPIAALVEDADEIIAAAARARLVLQVAHIERFKPAFRSIAARIDRPQFIDAERLASFQLRGIDVDVILDLMIHDIDLALALVGREVVGVSASGFGVLTGGIDIANAYLEFDNGCVANLSASRVSQTAVRKYRVFQHNLYVSADLVAGRVRSVRRAQDRIEQEDEMHDAGDALALQAAAFVAAVRGEAPVQVSGTDGRRALDIALTVGRLARERLQRFATQD